MFNISFITQISASYGNHKPTDLTFTKALLVSSVGGVLGDVIQRVVTLHLDLRKASVIFMQVFLKCVLVTLLII